MESSKKATVSVVVLSFNTPNLTKQTLQSISQSEQSDLEVICVDDGSSPENVRELALYCRTSGVIFLTNKSNRGIPASCNIGLHAATGEFFSVIGDDLVLPERYSEDVQILSKNRTCGFVCSQVALIDETNAPLAGRESWVNSGFEGSFVESPEKILLKGSSALAPTLTFRTSVLRDVGGWDEEFQVEDKPLLIKMAKLQISGYFHKKQTTLYRRYAGNISGHFRSNVFLEDLALIRKFNLKVSKSRFLFKCLIDAHYALLHLNAGVESVRKALESVSFPLPHLLTFSLPAKFLFYIASLSLSQGYVARKTRSYFLG